MLHGVPLHLASMKGDSQRNRNRKHVGNSLWLRGLNEGRFPKEPQSRPPVLLVVSTSGLNEGRFPKEPQSETGGITTSPFQCLNEGRFPKEPQLDGFDPLRRIHDTERA